MPCRDKCESLANGGHSIIFYELGIGQFASIVLRVDVVSDTAGNSDFLCPWVVYSVECICSKQF